MSSNNPSTNKSSSGKCNRSNPPCKYLHPPQHLRDILLQNGRNNLILRSIAMNLAANQPIYPQTGGHVPYGNGAIISSPLQATGGLTSYQHLAPTAGGQSTIVFNQAGQAFSIPISSLTGATTAMYAPDGSSYFSPVNQFTGQPTGPKTIRTDRLEVCSDFQLGQCLYGADFCQYAHPPANCPLDAEGLVTVCVDFVKGKCTRETCKYFHPPPHLVARLKALKSQTAGSANQILPSMTALQYSPSTIQIVNPLTLNSSPSILTATPTTYASSVASSSSSSLPTGATTEDDPNYANGFVPAYQQYSGQYQTIYARAPSVDVKDTSLINSTNASINVDPNSSSNNTVTEIKAVIDPVSSASSITQQTKKRPLEDDTATTGAYLQLQPGGQYLTTAPCVQTATGGSSINNTHQQKRPAIADPTTGIPMAAYPVTTFPYPTASPLQIPFQAPYFTAVPMTFAGYAPHMPRL